MNERLISFNEDLVRAILEGRKTQTRRIAKKQPASRFGKVPSDAVAEAPYAEHPDLWIVTSSGEGVQQYEASVPFARAHGVEYFRERCPYGKPGDRILVRERARIIETSNGLAWAGNVRDDLESQRVRLRYEADQAESDWLPYPSRLAYTQVGHCIANGCYREAARLKLDILGVRLERLKDISDTDAKAEGIGVLPLQSESDPSAWYESAPGQNQGRSAVQSFIRLWESLNGKGSWDVNPWLWVVEWPKYVATAAA